MSVGRTGEDRTFFEEHRLLKSLKEDQKVSISLSSLLAWEMDLRNLCGTFRFHFKSFIVLRQVKFEIGFEFGFTEPPSETTLNPKTLQILYPLVLIFTL